MPQRAYAARKSTILTSRVVAKPNSNVTTCSRYTSGMTVVAFWVVAKPNGVVLCFTDVTMSSRPMWAN